MVKHKVSDVICLYIIVRCLNTGIWTCVFPPMFLFDSKLRNTIECQRYEEY